MRDQLRPAAEVAVALPGLAVAEAEALAISRGFRLVRISPTDAGPYPTAYTFNLNPKRIVGIIEEETVTKVLVG